MDSISERHLRAAHGYIELGMLEDAQEELEEIQGEDAEHRDVVLMQMLVWQKTGEWHVMRQKAEILTERDPDEANWFILLAYATRRDSSLEDAQDILEKAMSLHPEEPTIQYNLACYACQLDDEETAKALLTSAVELCPAFLDTAEADEDLQSMKKFVRKLRKERKRKDPRKTAEGLVKSGCIDEARQMVNKILELGDEKALVLLMRSRLDEVTEMATEALWIHWRQEAGNEAAKKMDVGVELLDAKDLEGAVRVFQDLSELYPNWVEAKNKLATVLYLNGELEESMEICREVVAEKPHHFGAWNGMVMCAIKLQRWDIALEACQELLEVQPHVTEAKELYRFVESKMG